MVLNNLQHSNMHWVDLAEVILIALTLLGLLISIITGKWIYTLVPVCTTPLINLVNRLRLEKRLQKKLASNFNQLQQNVVEQSFNIPKTEPNFIPPTNLGIKEIKTIASLEKEVARLQQSLKEVIEYLNNESLPERVKEIEKEINKITAQLAQINSQIAENNQLKEVNLSQSNPSISLPAIGLKPQQWKYCQTLTGHEQAVTALAISSDNKYLTSVSWDQTLKLWNLSEGRLEDSITAHDRGILSVVFAGEKLENYCIATGGFDHTIKLWSIEQDPQNLVIKLKKTLTGHSGSIHEIALAATKQILLSASYDQTVKQWDFQTGKKLESSYDELGALKTLAVHEPTELIASAGGDGSITLWQLGSDKALGYLGGNISSVESLRISPDGLTLAAACVDGNIRIWELREFSQDTQITPILIIRAHGGPVKCVRFSADGETLYSSGADGLVKLWDFQKNEQIGVLQAMTSEQYRLTRIVSLAISSDDRLLVAGSVNGEITIWVKEE